MCFATIGAGLCLVVVSAQTRRGPRGVLHGPCDMALDVESLAIGIRDCKQTIYIRHKTSNGVLFVLR